VYKQILINAKLKTGKTGQENRDDWEKSIKVVKVCIELVVPSKKENTLLAKYCKIK
jgi:hypothetical protein